MKKLIVIIAVLFLSACAGSGSIKWNEARKIKVGMTEKEVTEVMGSPYQAQVLGNDGTYRWVWVDVNLMMGTQKMSAELKNGVVVSVPFIPESFGN